MRQISLDLLEIAENSLDAGAAHVHIVFEVGNDKVCFEVNDDGEGMSEGQIEYALSGSPIGEAKGHGVSLVRQNCLESGGKFEMASVIGEGTRVRAEYGLKNADLGGVGETYITLIDDRFEVGLTLKAGGNTKTYNSSEYTSASRICDLQALGVLRLIREDINKFIRQNGGAVL